LIIGIFYGRGDFSSGGGEAKLMTDNGTDVFMRHCSKEIDEIPAAVSRAGVEIIRRIMWHDNS